MPGMKIKIRFFRKLSDLLFCFPPLCYLRKNVALLALFIQIPAFIQIFYSFFDKFNAQRKYVVQTILNNHADNAVSGEQGRAGGSDLNAVHICFVFEKICRRSFILDNPCVKRNIPFFVLPDKPDIISPFCLNVIASLFPSVTFKRFLHLKKRKIVS